MIYSQTPIKEGELRESLKETDWAWLAGFIDGEGHLGIRRGYTENRHLVHYAEHKSGWEWYSPRLSVNNTNIPSIEKCAYMLNGVMTVRKPISSNLCLIYGVEIAARDKLLIVLPRIIPYMVVKKDIAVIMLKFCRLPRGSDVEKHKLFDDSVTLSQAGADRTLSPRGFGRCNGQG